MWRNTAKPLRVFIFDARILFPLLIFCARPEFRTFYIALGGIAFFYLLERLGLTVPAAFRAIRALFAGRVRPSVTARRKRRFS